MNILKFFLLLTVLLYGGAVTYAQETSGSIQGRITDSTGRPLGGVTLTAVHLPTGTRYVVETSGNGYYLLPGLRIGGPYTLDITYTGMVSQHREQLQVTLGDPRNLSFVLAPEVQELTAVTVRGERNQAGRFGGGLTVTKDQMLFLPSGSRSLQDFTRLSPQGSKDNTFLGSSFRYNNITLDGAVDNDAIGFAPSLGGQTGTSAQPGGSTRTNPISLDAIEAIQVELSPYDVKLGNFTGGSINAVTRSGTNTPEGSIYVYGRNASVTGPDNSGDGRKMPSAFHELQTGFHLGFPVVKNKIFFFTNEEITRRQDPIAQEAGSKASEAILSASDAEQIRDTLLRRYNIDPGTYKQYNIYSNSLKFFNRLDWNLDDHSQLALRNNTISSQAINLERDQQDFRFSGIGYQQVNNQTSTVAELHTRFNNQFSNTLIGGYTDVHDFRNPLSDPAIPQVQIVGNTPGTTIFLGTDREASIFNMKQQTIELTDNVTVNLGKHHLSFGTHNEFYHINYGFVNSWNGRVDYPSILDFLNNNPDRVRANYNYTNNTRGYILSHPGAIFNINFYSLYAQDEIHTSDRFRITVGLRGDYTSVPHKQILSSKTRNALTDPGYGTTFTYMPLNQDNNSYLNVLQASPRIGFQADLNKDKSLQLRGGMGLFTGRIPMAWLGYAFYNNGDTYGAYDQNTSNGGSVFAPGTDPLKYDRVNGGATFAAQNGQVINNVNAGKTEVDAVNNHFVMPQVFRSSLALDYKGPLGFKYTFEGMFTKTLEDVMFQQVNIKDAPSYYAYDTGVSQQKQPIFSSTGVNPAFTNAYEMSNTKQGYRFSLTAKLTRTFPFGLDVMAAYTYGVSKDVSNGIRNSMESNWQLNPALNPNNPGLAYSNFDVRHRILGNIGYRVSWNEHLASVFSLYVNLQSGTPYTYGFVNYTVQNTPQQISLAYIPNESEAVNFFQNYADKNGNAVTAASQAQAFNQFIDGNAYLKNRRGNFTERNGARTPWNNDADFRFRQDFILGNGKHIVSFTWDIINLTNLLDKKWGWSYYVPDTYNSTASVGLVPYIPARQAQGYPIYQFINPGKPYSVDYMNSRWQMEAGVRYSF